jgi:transitional endoplasmic reticulum ATPase
MAASAFSFAARRGRVRRVQDQLEALRQAVAVSPDNVPLLLLYGQALLAATRHADAEAAFQRALRVEPANEAAQLGLARALFQAGRLSDAAVRAEALAARNPAAAGARLLLCRILLAEGNAPEAGAHYRAAVAADPACRDPEWSGRSAPPRAPRPSLPARASASAPAATRFP